MEFEDGPGCLAQLQQAGVAVYKLQISAGLRLPGLTQASLAGVREFDDPVYLHQVVQRGPGSLERFVDLPQAFASLSGPAVDREWRVHFRVPVFLDHLPPFRSTQPFIREVLAMQRVQPVSAHLEVETYTWDVLPPSHRRGSVDEAVARETGMGAFGARRVNLSVALRLGRISNLPTVWINALVGSLLGSSDDDAAPVASYRRHSAATPQPHRPRQSRTCRFQPPAAIALLGQSTAL